MMIAILTALALVLSASALPPTSWAADPAPAVDEYVLVVPGNSGGFAAGSSDSSARPTGSADGRPSLHSGVAGETATSESALESVGSTLIPDAPALIALAALVLIALAALVPRLRAQ